MEFLTLAATAIATTVMTKFWEKTGEKLGEKVFTESEKFLISLQKKSPATFTAIEKVPQEPLDYGQAVLEVAALAKADSEIAESIKALTAAAEEDPNVKLAEKIQEINKTLTTQEPTLQNLGKLAEKIGVVVYSGGVVSIQTLNL